MRTQQQSKTFQPGLAWDHEQAVSDVFMFLCTNKKNRKWSININEPMDWTKDKEFLKQLPKDRFPGHTADIAILKETYSKETGEIRKYKQIAIIEINGKLGGYWKNKDTNHVLKYTPTRHDQPITHPNQIKNDKHVMNWCKKKKIKYIVLLKEEILGDCGKKGTDEVDTEPYLREKLAEFIK